MIENFPIAPHARVTWRNDPRHQGTVIATWPDGTADIIWDGGVYSFAVRFNNLRRVTPEDDSLNCCGG